MSGKILVTYASRNGSTVGVAENIGKSLLECGAQVDILPVQEVKDLAPYRAVVAGSAIQAAHWLPEAMQFIQDHQAELKRKPFAAFLVCITMSMKNGSYREQVSAWMDPVRRAARPVSEGLFAGALDISKVPSLSERLKWRMSVKMGFLTEGDHRDWDAIHSWAMSLPPLLINNS